MIESEQDVQTNPIYKIIENEYLTKTLTFIQTNLIYKKMIESDFLIKIFTFIQKNPFILYKWLPLFLILFNIYPVIILFWQWFPWFVCSYYTCVNLLNTENLYDKISNGRDKTIGWLTSPNFIPNEHIQTL